MTNDLTNDVDVEALQAEYRSCRIELLIALHGLASNFENILGKLAADEESYRKAKGDIAHALTVADRWNWNGGVTAAVPGFPVFCELDSTGTLQSIEMGNFVRWYGPGTDCRLDGSFSAQNLEELAAYMRFAEAKGATQ